MLIFPTLCQKPELYDPKKRPGEFKPHVDHSTATSPFLFDLVTSRALVADVFEPTYGAERRS